MVVNFNHCPKLNVASGFDSYIKIRIDYFLHVCIKCYLFMFACLYFILLIKALDIPDISRIY
jgi:hypothetical protein